MPATVGIHASFLIILFSFPPLNDMCRTKGTCMCSFVRSCQVPLLWGCTHQHAHQLHVRTQPPQQSTSPSCLFCARLRADELCQCFNFHFFSCERLALHRFKGHFYFLFCELSQFFPIYQKKISFLVLVSQFLRVLSTGDISSVIVAYIAHIVLPIFSCLDFIHLFIFCLVMFFFLTVVKYINLFLDCFWI